jgi:hypothetical protein
MFSGTNILSGLSSAKSNSSMRELDDSFSGILQERMSASQTARIGRAQGSDTLKASNIELNSQTQRSDKPVIRNQTVSQRQPASSKTEAASDKVSAKEERSGEAPREAQSDDENLAVIDLVSLLIERLFTKLEQLSEVTQTQTDMQTGEKIENMVEALKSG